MVSSTYQSLCACTCNLSLPLCAIIISSSSLSSTLGSPEEMERRRLCWLLLLAVQIVSWVSATSRPFAANDNLVVGVPQPCHSPQALPVNIDPYLSSKEGYNFNSKIGSTPPSCEHKCYGCIPCEAIQVPTTSKQHSHLSIQYANYEPEGWKCKCGPSFYTP